jgi:hypothetical protein
MPYVPIDIRSVLNPKIDELITLLKSYPDSLEGNCNYTITRIVAASMKPDAGWRYANLSRAQEVFNAAGLEFNRRLVAPYEDKCIVKNGDLDEYKQ